MDKNSLVGWAIIVGVAMVSYKAGRKVGLADGEIVGVTKLFDSFNEVCSKKIEEQILKRDVLNKDFSFSQYIHAIL